MIIIAITITIISCGLLTMALCVAAGNADRKLEQMTGDTE